MRGRFLFAVALCPALALVAAGAASAFSPLEAALEERRPALPTSPDAPRVAAATLARALTQLGPIDVELAPSTGRLHALQGRLPAPPGLPAGAAAERFLRDHARLLPGASFALVRVDEADGVAHARFEQVRDGAPVLGCSAVVSLGPDGGVALVLADTVDADGPAAAEPLVTAGGARDLALAELGAGPGDLRAPPTTERAWLPAGDELTSVWRVRVPAARPLGDWEVLVDAASGAVVGRSNELATLAGVGSVYDTNPLTAPPVERELPDLDALSALVGRFCKVKNDDGPGASNAGGRYVYDPDDTHFDEVMAYHHANRIHALFASLGFTALDKPVKVTVHYGKAFDNAFFSPSTGEICLGDGNKLNDLAKEADVLYHEYTHAVTAAIVNLTYSGESGAMHEGYSDYFACSLEGEPFVGQWAVHKMGLPYMRWLEDDVHYPEDLANEVHKDGRIWGCALWDLRRALGREVADAVVHKSRSYLTSRAKFRDALRGCLEADRALFAGAHVAAITEAMGARGIRLGAAPPRHERRRSGFAALWR